MPLETIIKLVPPTLGLVRKLMNMVKIFGQLDSSRIICLLEKIRNIQILVWRFIIIIHAFAR